MEAKRYQDNPIIKKSDVPFRVNSIFNAGAVKFNNDYLLLCRIEMPNGRSSFVIAKSKDGINFQIDDKPCLTPEDHNEWYEYVEWGIEDPRITKINEKYYILYTGFSKYCPLVILSATEDFKMFDIKGTITEPSNKDAVLFPEKIDGFYWKIDRPSAGSRRDMWISKSPDLIHWGEYRALMECEGGTWGSDKIGASTQPIKTKGGWLMLYHGVRGFGVTSIYKLGAMLLDLNNPYKILGKSKEPILAPEYDYERIGDVPNVVFTAGWILEENNDVKIYYSGADMNICLATTTVNELISICK
jgi:predicted GH43/DUF377 family glycosyl hydrolase